ncbi:MAG: molybdenum cofactor guanylyltransferase [Halieaceae bacterium]|jgi:molybdopterin-guanine dinucleotide biosynthesis protein A|nr:molybdenum cofactor guanylyltransferase [Halieaceae bacterium]
MSGAGPGEESRERGTDRAEGVVLAGGAGRRVHGRDKGLLTVGAQPAALLVARRLADCCDRVLISANRNRQAYRDLGVGPVVADQRSGHRGPLAGLEAVRPLLRQPLVLVAPCDLPDLPGDVPAALLTVLRGDRKLDAVYAHSAAGHHYLLAALRLRALCGVSAQLDSGGGAVRDWLATLNTAVLPLGGDPVAGLRDRNAPQDWEP